MKVRKKRTFIHKGKIRFKYRIPRKLKKKNKIRRKKASKEYDERLKKLHGDNWFEYWVCGG